MSPGTITQKKRPVDMTTGPIYRQILLYVIPIIMGEIIQQLYSTVDIAIAGNFIGKQALAAIGATSTIVNTIIGFFVGFSTGAAVVIGQYFGAKDQENLRQAVRTVVFSTVVIGIVISVVGFFATPPLLRLLNTPGDAYEPALVYLRWYFCGSLGLVMYNLTAGILRAVGDSRRPLYVLIFCALLNIALDLLFVVTFDMGIAGAAVATVVSQFISAGVLLAILCKTRESYGITLQRPYINKRILKRIINNGLPIGLHKSIVSLSNTVVISYINRFGSGAMAGWSVYRRIDQVITQTVQGISLATTTFVSQNIGAERHDRIKKGVRAAMVIAVTSTLVMGGLIVLFRIPIIGIFNSEPDVLAFGSEIMLVMIPFQAINCIAQIMAGELRGRGQSKLATVFMLSTYVGVRQLYLNVGWAGHQTLNFVLFSYPVTWALCALCFVIYARVRQHKSSTAPPGSMGYPEL